jgi:hypothetical protein
MEIFRDLFIHADAGRMSALVESVEHAPAAGWPRDHAAEERIRRSPFGTGAAFCFTREAKVEPGPATLVLSEREPGVFHVSNIIPLSKHELSRTEYNRLLEEYFEVSLRPAAEREGLTVELTESRAELEHWMTAATAAKLRSFSACANKATGSAHPRDRERWNEFVLSAHRDGSRMDAATLRRWLVEAEGWPAEVADQLAVEYEYGRELLTFAEGHRRSA